MSESVKKRSSAYIGAVASLLSLAAVAFLGKSYETGLRGIDSNIHAAVSMSVTSGDGIKPRLPIPIKNFSASAAARPGSTIDPDRTFNDHPFFVFWVNGLVMRALGPSGWSARLLTGLFSVGSVLLTMLIGTALVSRAFGVLAALFLIFCRDFILTSATVSLDTALVFFILLAFYFWIRRRWLALGVAAGVGLWVKTPLVLLVFPVALINTLLGARKVSRATLKRNLLGLAGSGTLALALGSLVWIYTGVAGGWELVEDYWIRQLWGTAVGGRGQAQGWDWGSFFFYNLRTGFLPGLPFLAVALVQIARRKLWATASVRIPLIAIGIIALLVTSLKFKMGHYFTPIFPFLALLTAHFLGKWLWADPERESRFYKGISVVTPAFLAFLLVWPLSFGPDAFVALRRFVPLIQTHGSCDDVVALVPGGEPVGSDLDYTLYLNFYTGRTVRTVSCQEISAQVESPSRPAWVIVAHENIGCLAGAARSRYSTIFRVGTQYLLTSLVSAQPIVDLTPLNLDLQAVTDCKAPPYPRDRWHRYVGEQ